LKKQTSFINKVN